MSVIPSDLTDTGKGWRVCARQAFPTPSIFSQCRKWLDSLWRQTLPLHPYLTDAGEGWKACARNTANANPAHAPQVEQAQHTARQLPSTIKSQHTTFLNTPIPSILHSTTSPSFRKVGGTIPIPTPAGVPVAIMVPAWSVMPSESMEMISAMPAIRFPVLESTRRQSRCKAPSA